MARMAGQQCPICGAVVLSRDQNKAYPFCSDRCRAIDLGKWLGGEYRVPVKADDEDEDGEGPIKPPLDT